MNVGFGPLVLFQVHNSLMPTWFARRVWNRWMFTFVWSIARYTQTGVLLCTWISSRRPTGSSFQFYVHVYDTGRVLFALRSLSVCPVVVKACKSANRLCPLWNCWKTFFFNLKAFMKIATSYTDILSSGVWSTLQISDSSVRKQRWPFRVRETPIWYCVQTLNRIVVWAMCKCLFQSTSWIRWATERE